MGLETQIEPQAVVITGTGLVSALGADRQTTWEALAAGRSALGPMTALEQPGEHAGGQAVPLPDGAETTGPLPREVAYLRHALRAALQEAGVTDRLPYAPRRCGLVLGTTLHGMRATGRFYRQSDPGQLRDFQAASVLRQAAAGLAPLDLSGLAVTTCAACSSGLSSIGLAVTLLASGELDLVIAGGYDTVSEYAYGGFQALRLMTGGPLKPFCHDREGMKLGEGYGVLVLERAESAAGRGVARAWPVLGVGESADAYHLTQPHPEGHGAARAMRAALDQAQLAPDAIGLIGAHATGTPSNEQGEAAALQQVFGAALPQVPVVAFKTHLGHTLGGAGAVELILSLTAMERGLVPPTAHVQPEMVQFPQIRLHHGPPRPATIGAVLNTSLGFGGANTSVVVGAARALAVPPAGWPAEPRAAGRAVCLTGVGVIFPDAVGNAAFAQRLRDATHPMLRHAPEAIPPAVLAPWLNTPRARRMSDYVKLSLAATQIAMQEAGLSRPEGGYELGNCGALLGTTHGSAAYSEAYYQQIVQEGLHAANPMLFAEGVPNAGAAHLSMLLGLEGPCQTFIGSRTAGLEALRLAWQRVACGQWDRAVISCAEEATDLLVAAYRHCGLHAAEQGGAPLSDEAGFILGPGAVTLIFEAESVAQARGAHVFARCGAATGAADHQGHPRQAAGLLGALLADLGAFDAAVSSASGTALGRIEAAALARHHGAAATERALPVTSLYGHVAEVFSASPLGAIAACALTGHLPRLHGGLPTGLDRFLAPATGEEAARRVAFLASDPFGPMAGVVLDFGG